MNCIVHEKVMSANFSNSRFSLRKRSEGNTTAGQYLEAYSTCYQLETSETRQKNYRNAGAIQVPLVTTWFSSLPWSSCSAAAIYLQGLPRLAFRLIIPVISMFINSRKSHSLFYLLQTVTSFINELASIQRLTTA